MEFDAWVYEVSLVLAMARVYDLLGDTSSGVNFYKRVGHGGRLF